MKLIEILTPLSSNSKLTEEYAYNHYGDYTVIDGSTLNDYKLKVDTFDYDGDCLCITTAGIYAGNVSIYSGKFSVGNNVKCYFLNKKIKNVSLNYLAIHLMSIAEKCITGKTGDYASLNISMFENYDFEFATKIIQRKCSEFYEKFKIVQKKINFIQNIVNDQDYNMNLEYDSQEQVPSKEIFKLSGGCSKLTEEFRYNNSDNKLIPVYTGAKNFENIYINNDSIPDKYKFKDYDMKVTRKGEAGYVMLVDEELFTINDDAYAIKNITHKKILDNKLIYLWLFRKYASRAVVDKNGNGTFSKTVFENFNIKIPSITIQKTIIKYMFIYEELLKLLFQANNELNIIKSHIRELNFDNN